MAKLTNLLPKKLSDCIDVALVDLDAAKAEGMKIDMGGWYSKDGGTKKCSVCLAGAVMAREFELENDEAATPGSLVNRGLITEHDLDRLNALNCLRMGYVAGALRHVGKLDAAQAVISVEQGLFRGHNDDIGSTDTKEWRSQMNKIKNYLVSKGL